MDPDDQLTDGTLRAIVTHNETRLEICGQAGSAGD